MPKPSHSSPRVKGIAFRTVVKTLEQLRGEALVDRALRQLPAYLGDGLRHNTITASNWYPIDWYRDLFAAIVATTGEGEAIVRELGHRAAYADMSSVYKGIYKLLSPEVVLALSARLFSNYYDTGTVRIVESREHFVRAAWSGCVGFDRNLWLEVLASCETYLELSGAQQVRTHIQSGAGANDDHMDVCAQWT
jgi:hypothetical protein